jgi:GTP cyclohydrolase I
MFLFNDINLYNMCEADFCLIIFMESVIYVSISMANLSDVIEKILQEACDRFQEQK